jgi:gamma-glutamylcysteine synthetase
MYPMIILVEDFIKDSICHIFCRIGTEHEKFGFERETLKPMSYEQIAQLLEGIAERFNWEKLLENRHIIGLKQVRLKHHRK